MAARAVVAVAVYDIDHPTRVRFSVVGCPVRLSDSPCAPTRAPRVGEHTEGS